MADQRPPSGSNRLFVVFALVAALGLVGNLYLYERRLDDGAARPPDDSMEMYKAAQTVSEIEVSAQATEDNYGLNLFLTAHDSTGKEVPAHGKVIISIAQDRDGEAVWSNTYDITPFGVSKAVRGQGPFKKDTLLYFLGRVNTESLFTKAGDMVEVRAILDGENGTQLKAKETVFIP